MLNIKEEYKRTQKFSKKFLCSRIYKDDREIFILGAFSELLEKANCDRPEYFEKLEPPDFHTFEKDKSFFKQIEIVENLHWGRRRGDEKDKPFDESIYLTNSGACKINLWYSFIKNINNKFLKHYGKDCWLLIYHNIPVLHMSQLGSWTYLIFNFKEEFQKRGLLDFDNPPYEQIYVMSANCNELVSIFPEDKVICSKYTRISSKK